ncbi:zinc finger, CCHC-type containing protein, partial [Tanacetum coccineum]
FLEWYRNLRIVLSTEDKLPFLEQPIPVLPVPLQGQANPPDIITTHQAWVKAQKEITGLMLMTMDPEIQKTPEHLGAYDMLKELKTLYVQQADQELLQNRVRIPRMQTRRRAAPPFAPKPKNPPTPKKDNPAKDAICHQYGKVGHWRRNCPIYLSELMKKKKLSQGASTSGLTFVGGTLRKSDQLHQTFEKSSIAMTYKLDDMIELPKSQPKRTYNEDLECEIVMVKMPKCMAWLDDEPIGDLDTMEHKVKNPSPQSTPQVLLSFDGIHTARDLTGGLSREYRKLNGVELGPNETEDLA